MRWPLSCAAVGLFALSCSAVSGLDGLSFDGDGGAAASASGQGGTTGSHADASSTSRAGSGGGHASSTASASATGSGGAADDCPAKCVVIPLGWAPLRTTVTSPDAIPPPCSDGTEPTVGLSGPAPAPECAACTCDAAGVSCAMPELDCWVQNDLCLGAADIAVTPVGCQNLIFAGGSNAVGSCSIAQGPPTGVCSVTGGQLQPQPAFATSLSSCAAPVGSGCAADEVCSAGAELVCVASTDPNAACPVGFSDRYVTYAAGSDTRSCTACGCVLSCSGASVTVYDVNACQSTSVTVATGTCTIAHNTFDMASASARGQVGAAGVASCSGGVPSGAVTPSGPATTVCCIGSD